MNKRSNWDKLNNQRISVNRVYKTEMKQPIRSREQRNSRELSKISRSAIKLSVRMSQSPSYHALNGMILPANNAADKLLRKTVSLVKN